MKIVIIRKASDETQHLIASQFPSDWNLVFVAAKDLPKEIEEADVLIPENEKIGGTGLDVFEEEPLPADSPLRKLNNVILTPHMAGEPDGLYLHFKRLKFFAENAKRVSIGKPPNNALNRI
jgi:phosphoglycerate dehydrogenase-like enzyme